MPEEPNFEQLVRAYPPEARLVFESGKERTLAQVLLFEDTLCAADPERRQDPEARTRWLAGKLAAGGSLLPEHAHLLESEG